MTLVAGYTLGTTFSRILLLEFVTVREAMDTVVGTSVWRTRVVFGSVGTHGDFGLEELVPRHLRLDY